MPTELRNLENRVMGTADSLRQERNGRTVPLARFLADYKKDAKKICYGFVEGKDDPSYYRTVIKNRMRTDCHIILYPSGGKENVKYIYDEIHKREFSGDNIVYFMDRDLSDIIIDDNIIDNPYVYITDNYSIENDILNPDTIASVMQDLLGFCNTPINEIDKAKDLFEEQKAIFEIEMLPIMANIVIWKRKRIKPANYNNLKIKSLFKVLDGKVVQKVTDDKKIEAFYKQSEVDYVKYNKDDEDTVIAELQEKSLISKVLRGKYLAVFFIMFCNSVYKEYMNMGISAPTNTGRELSDRDIMETIAPRARVPISLEIFINKTIVQYFDKNAA